jgi:hypothetical protein
MTETTGFFQDIRLRGISNSLEGVPSTRYILINVKKRYFDGRRGGKAIVHSTAGTNNRSTICKTSIMAVKITYLIGAGASANALPLIRKNTSTGKPGLPEELKNFAEEFRSSPFSTKELSDSLLAIAEKCNEFGTPDLYAKFLLETGDEPNYTLLKKLISSYFKYKQELPFTGPGYAQGYFDARALSFLTTIAQNEKLPQNIHILSWNYDSQLEMAAKKLKPARSNVYQKIKGFTTWPNFQDSFDYDKRHQYKNEDIFLLHLNGIAGYNYSKSTFAEKTDTVYNFDPAVDTLLSFAWEDESNDNKKSFVERRMEKAKKIAEGTDILVVIGYSFPFFNRKVDDIVFHSMKASLTKIYFQDPYLNGSQLVGQFNLSDKIAANIQHIAQTDNYHIPFEL